MLSADQAQCLLEKMYSNKNVVMKMSDKSKLDLLVDIRERLSHWGMTMQLAKGIMHARNLNESTRDSSERVAFSGIVFGAIVLDALDGHIENFSGKARITKVDFVKDFGVATDVNGYETYVDSTSKARYIVLEEGEVIENNDEGVAVILGAGNFPHLGVCDTLHHIFVRNKVAILKLHPLQEGGKEALEYLLYPLICDNLLSIIIADIPVTKSLIYSEKISAVHITGGIQSHDAIVWGDSKEEQIQRKSMNNPILKAEMCSELGAITPYIVCPGFHGDDEWTPTIMLDHITSLVFSLVTNTSCACLSPKVLILPDTQLAETFIDILLTELSQTKIEPTWYPGTEERYSAWKSCMLANNVKLHTAMSPHLEVANEKATYLPVLLADFGCVNTNLSGIPDLTWTQIEPFAPVLSILRVKCDSFEQYATDAFKLANESLFGNLSCTVLSPPSGVSIIVQKVLKKELLYGTTVINGSTFKAYESRSYWGGPRGVNSLANAKSGVGNVANALRVANASRCIVLMDFNNKAAVLNAKQINISEWLVNTVVRFWVRGLRGLLFWEK